MANPPRSNPEESAENLCSEPRGYGLIEARRHRPPLNASTLHFRAAPRRNSSAALFTPPSTFNTHYTLSYGDDDNERLLSVNQSEYKEYPSYPPHPGPGDTFPRSPSLAPGETPSGRLLRIILPASTVPVVTAVAWFWAAYTITKPRQMGGGVMERSPEMTYGVTLLSTGASILVSWGFGRTVAYYTSKRLANGSLAVNEVTSWVYLSTHQVRWAVSTWLLATLLAAICLGLEVSGFNAIFQPSNYNVSVSLQGRPEMDVTTPAFSAFFTEKVSNGYPDCYWPNVRGISTPSCTFSSGFFELLLGGRAAVEEAATQPKLVYSRVGPLNMLAAWDFLTRAEPELTFNINSFNVENSASLTNTLSKFPRNAEYTIEQELQGISADINCTWSPTSPIASSSSNASSSDSLSFITTTAQGCDPSFSIVQYVPAKRAFSFDCADGNLYVRLFDLYHSGAGQRGPSAADKVEVWAASRR
ncbi:hypothetical protein P7C70_g633, partial [Phenoliferia sp. Uapishka_3]